MGPAPALPRPRHSDSRLKWIRCSYPQMDPRPLRRRPGLIAKVEWAGAARSDPRRLGSPAVITCFE